MSLILLNKQGSEGLASNRASNPQPEVTGLDYHHIYREFIANRKAKLKPEGYTERHHILPRSLGGRDVSANLIDLTARDHYFAHCCLAKMHGGKMWSALFAVANMAKSDQAWRYFCRRRMVEAARVKAAKRRSEQMRALWASGQFTRNRVYKVSDAQKAKTSAALVGRSKDPEAIARMIETRQAGAVIYTFEHRDGLSFVGSGYQLRKRYGLYQSSVSRMLAGKLRTVDGWRLVPTAHSASSTLFTDIA